MDSNGLSRGGNSSNGGGGSNGGDEKFYVKYEALKEDYDSLWKRYSDLLASHTSTANKLDISQEEVSRVKKLYEEALQETSNAVRERNCLKQQCTVTILKWDLAIHEKEEYKDSLNKLQQKHEEMMKEVNQGLSRAIKIKRLTEERDAALQEYSLVMSERKSVLSELDKLNNEVSGAKKTIKALEVQNKELLDKIQEAGQEAEVSVRTRDWAFSERDKLLREKESLRTLSESLRRERDRAVADLSSSLSAAETLRQERDSARRELDTLRESNATGERSRDSSRRDGGEMRESGERSRGSGRRLSYFSPDSASFGESKDSAIDSDSLLASPHYSIKLSNVRGAEHGLVLEPGVYISRILPGSPAAKENNLNIGDRVLYINDMSIDNVEDAILALSETLDPITLTLSRSAPSLSSLQPHLNNNNTSSNISGIGNVNSMGNNISTSSGKSEKEKSGVLKDIFRVRLNRKKLSSPELETLDRLDSAIEEGGTLTERKGRRKRGGSSRTSSSRGGGGERVSKNGTWPRVLLNRHSVCSYTLPHSPDPSPQPPAHNEGGYVSLSPPPPPAPYFSRPEGSTSSGRPYSTVGIRRPHPPSKERKGLHSLGIWWDGTPHPTEGRSRVGYSPLSPTQPQGQGHNMGQSYVQGQGHSQGQGHKGQGQGGSGKKGDYSGYGLYSEGRGTGSSSSTLGRTGNDGGGGGGSNLGASDGSSIDFSVRSGNMDVLDMYINRNLKVKNNSQIHGGSSESSDQLDKVISPPSLPQPFGMGLTNTLNRFSNRALARYSAHHHDNLLTNSPYSPHQLSHPSVSSLSTSSFDPHLASLHSHSHSQSKGGECDRGCSSGTFPRKKEVERIRIPSNQSVASRLSGDRYEPPPLSPLPNYSIQVLDGGGEYGMWGATKSGELRSIRIDKSVQPLGIQISCKEKGGGVFISSVSQGSVAQSANLLVGSQILEICGINMRSASYDHAARVLMQCKDTITMLVQYLPEKYRTLVDERSSSSEFGSESSSEDGGGDGGSSSPNSITPCNSPTLPLPLLHRPSPSSKNNSSTPSSSKNNNKSTPNNILSGSLGKNHESESGGGTPGSTLTRKDGSFSKNIEKARYVHLNLNKSSSNLGISLVGGNAVGIFIHSVQKDSVAEKGGLRTGDQILEYNGTELRDVTAEDAAFELAKPLDKVTLLAQYNIQRYNEIKEEAGDGFYIRSLFDLPPPPPPPSSEELGGGDKNLNFHKDEILWVDNTMYNGKPGRWRAWKVDSEGHRKIWGIIPSKYKIEEDLMFKRSLGELDSDRRSSTLTRRSFFRRKSAHQSSRELASFSDFSLNSPGGGGERENSTDKEHSLLHLTYQRVERLDYMRFVRPVIVLGGLSEYVSDRLVQEYSHLFARVPLEAMHCSGSMLEKGLAQNIFVDYKRKGSYYECVTMGAIKDISSKKLYCIVEVSTSGIERLQRAQLYPIVLLVKFKSPKQIREIKDLRTDKISGKGAKELYEHSLKVEAEYKHLITATVPGGTNISYLATQVKTAVEREQSKTLWVPV